MGGFRPIPSGRRSWRRFLHSLRPPAETKRVVRPVPHGDPGVAEPLLQPGFQSRRGGPLVLGGPGIARDRRESPQLAAERHDRSHKSCHAHSPVTWDPSTGSSRKDWVAGAWWTVLLATRISASPSLATIE